MEIGTDGPRLDARDEDPDVMDTSLDLSYDDRAKGKEPLHTVPPEVPVLQDAGHKSEQSVVEDALPKLPSLTGKISACVFRAH